MSVAVSFVGYTPPARFDAVPWTDAQIEEAAASDGTYAIIDTVSLGTPDVDPANPASRNFTTPNGTAPDLWYRVVFLDASLVTSEPTTPVHNTPDAVPFASADELARILKLRPPTAAQIVAMDRVLSTAAGEILAEIDLADGDALEDWQRDLCAQVNLDRAADLWRHTESIPGVLGGLDDAVPMTPGRYSWERYAQRLAPVKRRWGLA